MHVIAERGILVHRVNDRLAEVTRMRCGESHTPQSRDFTHARQQSGKIPTQWRWVAVAVDVLADQLNLGVAGVCELPRLADHALRGSATLRPARERNHAIRARLVASFDDRDEGALRFYPSCESRIVCLIAVQPPARHMSLPCFLICTTIL